MPNATNGDVTLYYEAFGTKNDPVLLLVNGLGSQCINFKAQFCQMLAARASGSCASTTAMSAFQPPQRRTSIRHRRHGRRRLRRLGCHSRRKAHIAGWSMGGMIVQAMAIAVPQRVLSMTSVMSAPGPIGASATPRSWPPSPPRRQPTATKPPSAIWPACGRGAARRVTTWSGSPPMPTRPTTVAGIPTAGPARRWRWRHPPTGRSPQVAAGADPCGARRRRPARAAGIRAGHRRGHPRRPAGDRGGDGPRLPASALAPHGRADLHPRPIGTSSRLTTRLH